MNDVIIPVASVVVTLVLAAIGYLTYKRTFAGQSYADRRYENVLRVARDEAATLLQRVETLKDEHDACFERIDHLEAQMQTLQGELVRKVVAEIVKGVREELRRVS